MNQAEIDHLRSLWLKDMRATVQGLTPGYHQRSGLTLAPDGRVLRASDAASQINYVDRGAAGISVASGGTYELFEFDQDDLGWWDAGDPSRVILPFTGSAFVIARMFWVPATPKDGNRSIEIHQERGGVDVDSWSISYRVQDTGLASGFDITQWPFFFVDVQAGDKLWGQVAQTNSGGASIPAHLSLWITPW